MKNFIKVFIILSGFCLFLTNNAWAILETRYCEVASPRDENVGLALTGDLRHLVENFNRENNRSCTEEIRIGMMWGIVLESSLALNNAADLDHDGDGFNFELIGPEDQPALIDLTELNLDEDHPGILVQIHHSRFRHLKLKVKSQEEARYAWVDQGEENIYQAVTVVGPDNTFYGHMKDGVFWPAKIPVNTSKQGIDPSVFEKSNSFHPFQVRY